MGRMQEVQGRGLRGWTPRLEAGGHPPGCITCPGRAWHNGAAHKWHCRGHRDGGDCCLKQQALWLHWGIHAAWLQRGCRQVTLLLPQFPPVEKQHSVPLGCLAGDLGFTCQVSMVMQHVNTMATGVVGGLTLHPSSPAQGRREESSAAGHPWAATREGEDKGSPGKVSPHRRGLQGAHSSLMRGRAGPDKAGAGTACFCSQDPYGEAPRS